MSEIHPTATPSHAPEHNREYVHISSAGDSYVILVNDATGDRWYLLESGRYTHAGFLPSTAAGRYAYDTYREAERVSPRRAYRRLHDDYMLPTSPNVATWDEWRAGLYRDGVSNARGIRYAFHTFNILPLWMLGVSR